MTRLCFGTFAQILRLCKLDNVTDLVLVGMMTRTVDPDCQYSNRDNATAVSRLFSCTGNLSSGGGLNTGSGATKKPGESISEVIHGAQKADKGLVVAQFREKVLGLIDEDKKERAVLALLELIENDNVLDDDKKKSFEKYLGKTKTALLAQREFELDELLAGIFLYVTAAAITNTVGQETIKGLTPDYLKGLTNSRGIRIADHLAVAPGRPAAAAVAADPPDQPVVQETAGAQKAAPDFRVYLDNAKEKYRAIKTLLNHDQPRPFYDFYVCNDIFRRPNGHRKADQEQLVEISKVTVKQLTAVSRFIIIAGAGGLGKSMMMRHLLLNAIDNHDQLNLLPIFVPLKDYDDSSPGILDYAFSKFASLGAGTGREALEEALQRGSCLFLFDGLDEIGMGHTKDFEQALEAFADRYPDNFLVISSRPCQAFISYSRFSVMQLQPFSRDQAVQLIDQLEFRPDEPSIKAKFRSELGRSLYWSHRPFIENPLLLTIMLMTFERFAEVPAKMHIFYREAFLALSVTHDASKGAYKRALKTGLSIDTFGDYFAELCFRSYREEKFELSETEFEKYFQELSVNDCACQASDFSYDLCANLCLMYGESGKYHFTHRSFQEYFCAVFFSKQKDTFISKLGDFFEQRGDRMFGDQTFNMLWDLIPDKVEAFIFIPFLEQLLRKCDEEAGYHTFLKEIYPSFDYQIGEAPDFCAEAPQAFLYSRLLKSFKISGTETYGFSDLPPQGDLLMDEFFDCVDENNHWVLGSREEFCINVFEYRSPEPVGWRYVVEIDDVFEVPENYAELLKIIDHDGFVLKREYAGARDYLKQLKDRQKSADDTLLDLL